MTAAGGALPGAALTAAGGALPGGALTAASCANRAFVVVVDNPAEAGGGAALTAARAFVVVDNPAAAGGARAAASCANRALCAARAARTAAACANRVLCAARAARTAAACANVAAAGCEFCAAAGARGELTRPGANRACPLAILVACSSASRLFTFDGICPARCRFLHARIFNRRPGLHAANDRTRSTAQAENRSRRSYPRICGCGGYRVGRRAALCSEGTVRGLPARAS